ncbi:MAG: GrpB family protein [Gemmatimonadaceae bacterium]|nr:GrpB family protein [Gemmatimonadaceae bacterium]
MAQSVSVKRTCQVRLTDTQSPELDIACPTSGYASQVIVKQRPGASAPPARRLASKPILDSLACYPQGAAVAAYIGVLTKSDYVHREQQERPGRAFFRRGTPRAYHVHRAAIDSAFWRDHLTFFREARHSRKLTALDGHVARWRQDVGIRRGNTSIASLGGVEHT